MTAAQPSMQTTRAQLPQGHKILIVEDEGLIAHDIASRLQALGHEVVATASTAKEALEHAGKAEIVLMDIRIDGPTDGIEAAAQIREKYGIPVVFLTAHADRATLERAKLADPFGYIVKPLAHSSLNTSIEIALYKHKVERQLAEREAWMRTILGSIGDAVVVTDPEGRVMMLNRAAEILLECVLPEAQGLPIGKIAHFIEGERERADVSESESAEPVALAILRDAPLPLDRGWKLLARSGREMLIEGVVAPVKVGGQAIGTVISFRDVSAREWEEKQVRQAQKLETAGRLAAGVATEYSNLLGIIRSQADNLVRQFSEYSSARKAGEEIQQAAAAAEQINRRLAVFGTRQVSQQETLSLNAMLRKVTKLIETVSGEAIEVSIRTNPATGRIKVDAEQIEQSIMTLVMHACAAMPEGGRLLIETGNTEIPTRGHPASYAVLAISYTGHEDDPEKLFEPSAAGDEGLALSTVHTIVAEHGGFVSAQRTAAGGCRFEMLLPRQAGQALLPQPATGRASSILLVDDRDRIRIQLHNFFEANGYNLLEAADGAEAVAIGQMHESGLDLVIAGAGQAEAIAKGLGGGHVRLLRIVDLPEAGVEEIRRPFSQQALLQRVEELLRPSPELESAASNGSSA
jgi:two-component system, cell cycle sensor histidine kinase and response regulator CckA